MPPPGGQYEPAPTAAVVALPIAAPEFAPPVAATAAGTAVWGELPPPNAVP